MSHLLLEIYFVLFSLSPDEDIRNLFCYGIKKGPFLPEKRALIKLRSLLTIHNLNASPVFPVDEDIRPLLISSLPKTRGWKKGPIQGDPGMGYFGVQPGWRENLHDAL